MIRKIFNLNTISVTGWFIGVLGLVTSFYFYYESVKAREPYFLTAESAVPLTEIFDTGKQTTKRSNQISVFWRTNENKMTEITGNIYVLRVYFWNNGKESIKQENLLSPMTIFSENPANRLLSANLIKASRPEINAVKISQNGKENSINFQFRILEQKEGFCAQIIYVGHSDHKIKFRGEIEGVTQVTTDNRSSILTRTAIGIGLLIAIFVIGAIVVLGFLFLFYKTVLQILRLLFRLFKKKLFARWHKSVKKNPEALFSITMILGAIIMLVHMLATRLPIESASIPESIRIEK